MRWGVWDPETIVRCRRKIGNGLIRRYSPPSKGIPLCSHRPVLRTQETRTGFNRPGIDLRCRRGYPSGIKLNCNIISRKRDLPDPDVVKLPVIVPGQAPLPELFCKKSVNFLGIILHPALDLPAAAHHPLLRARSSIVLILSLYRLCIFILPTSSMASEFSSHLRHR